MRKKSNRKPRPVLIPISPKQHQALILPFRMHLELLIEGQGTRVHAATVASALNIGVALAHTRKNQTLQDLFESAQRSLIDAMSPAEPLILPESVIDELKVALTYLDRYIGIQNTEAIRRAIEFCDQAIETGNGAEILRMPEL